MTGRQTHAKFFFTWLVLPGWQQTGRNNFKQTAVKFLQLLRLFHMGRYSYLGLDFCFSNLQEFETSKILLCICSFGFYKVCKN